MHPAIQIHRVLIVDLDMLQTRVRGCVKRAVLVSTVNLDGALADVAQKTHIQMMEKLVNHAPCWTTYQGYTKQRVVIA